MLDDHIPISDRPSRFRRHLLRRTNSTLCDEACRICAWPAIEAVPSAPYISGRDHATPRKDAGFSDWAVSCRQVQVRRRLRAGALSGRAQTADRKPVSQFDRRYLSAPTLWCRAGSNRTAGSAACWRRAAPPFRSRRRALKAMPRSPTASPGRWWTRRTAPSCFPARRNPPPRRTATAPARSSTVMACCCSAGR